jgi:hypothetical protein
MDRGAMREVVALPVLQLDGDRADIGVLGADRDRGRGDDAAEVDVSPTSAT